MASKITQHKVLKWIGAHCKFPSTAGADLYKKPCGKYLLEWQRQLIKDLFYPSGEVKKSGVMLYGMRKVSKSMLYSFVLYFMISHPKLVGAQIPILTGRSEEQAEGIILKFLQEQVGMSGRDDLFKVRKKSVTHKDTLNIAFAQHTQSEGLYGKQATGAIFDECSNMKDDSAIEAVTSSQTLVKGKPLNMYASNVPTDKSSFVFPMMRGFQKDKDMVVKKFCAPAKADPFDTSHWRANPFIDLYMRGNKRFEHIFRAYQKRAELAKQSKKSLQEFQRLYLGQAVSGDLEFIPTDRIKFVPKPAEVLKRKDLRWCVGIDCSTSFDFTAMSVCGWNESQDELYCKSWLYLPNTDRRSPSQKKVFESWASNGFIRLQDKPVLDFNEVIGDFFAFVQEAGIKPEKIVFDPALSSHYWESFAPYQPEKVKMTGRNMAPGISELERIGFASGLHFIGPENPAFLWHFENVTLKTTQRNFLTLNKSSNVDNIDLVDSICLPLVYMLANKKKKYLIGAYG